MHPLFKKWDREDLVQEGPRRLDLWVVLSDDDNSCLVRFSQPKHGVVAVAGCHTNPIPIVQQSVAIVIHIFLRKIPKGTAYCVELSLI